MLEHGLYGLVLIERTGMLWGECCTLVHKWQAFVWIVNLQKVGHVRT